MPRELVLCLGMHRSGTSITTGLLEAIGLALPGELIGADSANPTGYFENHSVVAAQERLLQDLGCWWPTEAASHGLQQWVRSSRAYHDHENWLTTYLEGIFAHQGPLLAIKDPRTSLLLPAWRTAAARLEIQLKLVICLRNPRDVCWSLVWRDGPTVGMGWQRAQRLWLGHYRALLMEGQGLPAQVVLYEHWLEPTLAEPQLMALAQFLGLTPSSEQRIAALERVRPELNHGGGKQLPPVARSLRLLHWTLRQNRTNRLRWGIGAVSRGCRLTLRAEQQWIALRSQVRLLWLLVSGDRHQQLEPALDRQLIQKQIGSSSLGNYWREYRNHQDLRPHPLISPAHLNRERQRCRLPPFRGAGDLFRYLLDTDLIPLNPHPRFDCRAYQPGSQVLGRTAEHPVMTFLRQTGSGGLTACPPGQGLQQPGACGPMSQLENGPVDPHVHPEGGAEASGGAAAGDKAGLGNDGPDA